MRTYCINLETSKKRKEYMETQLKTHKLDYEFFKAVDGRKMTVEEFYKNGYIADNLYHGFKEKKIKIHTRSFACAFSHLLIWKKFLEDETTDEYILVLEDDVMIGRNFQKNLDQYIQNAPTNWDFLYFDYNQFIGNKINKYWGQPKNNAGSGKNAFLSCYIIKRSGCKKLLDLMFPYKKNLCIDSIMRKNFDKFNAYFSTHRLAQQNKSFPSVRI